MNRNPKKEMPLLEHLKELRKRLFRIVVILLVGTACTLFFAEKLFELLQAPLLPQLPDGSAFIALSLMEGWLVYFKVAAVAAAFLTSPFWLYQVWAFLAPGLLKRERRLTLVTSLSSSICFLLGGLFCYFVIMPFGFGYLVGVLNETGITLMPQMKLYLSFVLQLFLAFGLTFELPIVIVLLVRWEIIELEWLRRHRRHAIVFAFIFGAIITPPDVITQIFVALPFIALYELGLLIARIAAVRSVARVTSAD